KTRQEVNTNSEKLTDLKFNFATASKSAVQIRSTSDSRDHDENGSTNPTARQARACALCHSPDTLARFPARFRF
ncbi:hypothetical protein SB783_27135, partial [Paraburkholderia sp. SIMBA_009]